MDRTFPSIFSYDPPPRTLNFVGREKQLDFLHENLRRELIPRTAAVVGPGGIGKTALVREFVRQRKEKTFWIRGSQIRTLGKDLGNLIRDLAYQEEHRPGIVVLDGLDEADDLGNYSIQIMALRRVYAFIVTARHLKPGYPTFPTIQLEGLTDEQSYRLLSMTAPKRVSARERRLLASKVQGHPLALLLIAQLLDDHTVEQIEMQLQGDWNDLLFKLPSSEKQIVEIVAPTIVVANEAMIERLKKAPQDLHKISPRKFEELIADLVQDMGWEIELTPQSKDGGKDILAFLKTDLGKLLCLIEAKHYDPRRPVQVGLVRQLYGTFVDHGANSAMLVTSSTFTKGAREFQAKHEYQLSLREYGDVVNWIRNYKTK